MAFNPLNLFAKNKTVSAEHLTEAIKPRPASERGFHGRFAGKKKAPKVKKKPEETKTSQPPIPKSSTFAGIPIRRFYTKDKWFFCVEDIVSLAGAPDVKAYLEQIKSKNGELLKNWQKMIEKLTYEVGEKSELLECAEAENILKIVLALDKPFPGPLARWLRETSQKIPA